MYVKISDVNSSTEMAALSHRLKCMYCACEYTFVILELLVSSLAQMKMCVPLQVCFVTKVMKLISKQC